MEKDALFGERQFEKLNDWLLSGQSLYRLTFKANVSVDGVQKTIEKSNFFQTRVQGMTKKGRINPNWDYYIC